MLGRSDTQVSLVRFKDTSYFCGRPSGASESAAIHGIKNTSTEFAVILVTCQTRENPAGMQVGKSGNLQICREEPSDEGQIPLATKPQNLTPLQIIFGLERGHLCQQGNSFANLMIGLGLRISLTMQNSLTYFLFVGEQYENFKALKPYMPFIHTKS